MDYIIDGFMEALKLIISFDPEIYRIIILSLIVSTSATIIASLIFIPLGIFLGISNFRGKKIFSRLTYTFMGIPSVVVGLLVYIFFSRRGPLGFLDLLFTPQAMIIAQSLLVLPLIFGLTYSLAKNRAREIKKIAYTLGANKKDMVILTIRELRIDILVNIATAFSRAISEVGAVMIVGGNIRHHTRVMTTSISMMSSMGDYPMALALGIILLIISFGIQSFIYSYSQGDEDEDSIGKDKKVLWTKKILDIDYLEIPQGKITGITGPNGSGKSTMLNIISNIDCDYEGRVRFNDRIMDNNIRKDITLVFQKPYLFRRKVYENITYPLKLRNIDKNMQRDMALKVIKDLEIEDLIDKKGHKLSGGETQKVALARAMVFRPKLLLLDEPTSNIDPESTKIIEREILNFNKKTNSTLIIITHNIDQSKRLCDEIVYLNQGKVVG